MKNSHIEEFLTREGAEFQFRSIDISDVNLKESKLNQSRLSKPIIDELVERYTLALNNGDKFPPIIIYKNVKYIIIDGNHRLHAYIRSGKLKIEAYLITNFDSMLVGKLTRMANRKLNGKEQTDSDMMAQAKWYYRTHDITLAEVASMWSITPGRLSDELRFESGNLRLSQHEIDYTKLNKTAVLRLSSIDDNSVMSTLAQLAIDAKLTANEINDVINATKSKHSEKERIAAVEFFKKRPEILERSKGKRKSGRTSSRTTFFKNLTSLTRFLEKKNTANALRISNKHDVERITKMRNAIVIQLDELLISAQSI